MPHPKLYLILLDALRHDYIDEQRTPFLAKLKNTSLRARVIETFGFNTRPAFFAGLYPEECNQCHLFEYNPESSPFEIAKYLAALPKFLQNSKLDGFLRKLLRVRARAIEKSRGNLAAAACCSPFYVPYEVLPYLSFAEGKFTDEIGVYGNKPTVFDSMRDKNLSWCWVAYPKYFGSSQNILQHYSLQKAHDVAFLHFSELDWIGHRYGPDSKEINSTLKDLDSILEKLLSQALENGSKLVLFGDHGMVKTKPAFDLENVIKSLDLKLGRDLIYFLDSTQARFWFSNSNAEKIIRNELSKITIGRFLDQSDYEKLRIRFSDQRFGELIFMLNGAEIIHPSFFDRSSSAPLGMHGYLPDVHDNATQVFAYGLEQKDLGEIMLTDVAGIINQMIQIL